jgi:hypothetical protein
MIRYLIPATLEAYQQLDGILRINADGSQSSIPCCTENTDWVAYLNWLAEGNTPEPYVKNEA